MKATIFARLCFRSRWFIFAAIDDKLSVVDKQKLEELVANAAKAKTSRQGLKSLLKRSLKAKLKAALSFGKLQLRLVELTKMFSQTDKEV